MINLFYPYVTEDMIDEVVKTLRSRFVGQGPKVDLFEKDFCKKFNVPYAVSVNSGTSALDTALDLLDLQPGDEVITTPYTCTATNLCILRKGCKIVWADIDPETMNISAVDVKNKITNKTRCIMQVHVAGIQANVDKYITNIPIISDAAQALGIFTGTIVCNSFQAIKTITTIDGGMVVVDNPEYAHKAKLMRWFGIDRQLKIKNNWQAYQNRKMTFDIDLPGAKRHMHDVSAAMGIVGLKHYNEVQQHRKNIFNIYKEGFKDLNYIKLVDAKKGELNMHWLATILVEHRDDFAKMMFEADVDVNITHVRNDLYRIFGGKKQGLLPVMDELEEKYICIPIGMHVSEDDAHYIVDLITKGWS